MTPPSPFTQIVQMLSALLGGVWARLFLGRAQAAALREMMAGMKAFDELFARWKAGELVVPPPLEGEGPEVRGDDAGEKDGKAQARPRTRGPRPAAARRLLPARPQARRRIVRTRPVNWIVIPRWIGPGANRRGVAVKRPGEWSG